MKYRFLKEKAIADIAFEAFGKDEKELLENSAAALLTVMAEAKKIVPEKTEKISLKAEKLDLLLYRFLSEIVFVKDKQNMLFASCKVRLEKNKNGFALEAELKGKGIEKIPSSVIRTDVKAVTFHLFQVEPKKDGWKTVVVLDV